LKTSAQCRGTRDQSTFSWILWSSRLNSLAIVTSSSLISLRTLKKS